MYQMRNAFLQVILDDNGSISALIHVNGIRIDFLLDDVRIETDWGLFSTRESKPEQVDLTDNSIAIRFTTTGYSLIIEYNLYNNNEYCQRYIQIANSQPLSIYRISIRQELAVCPQQVLDYNTFWNCPTVAFVRTAGGGMYTGFDHPYFTVIGDGKRIENTFEPSLILNAGEGYLSEANFFGLYRNSGTLLHQQIPPTSMRYNDVYHTRYRNPCGHIPLDKQEVNSFQAYARNYLDLRVDHFKLIFYQYFIPLPQQPDSDEEEALYYHYIDNFLKMGGDLVTFNPLVRNAPPISSTQGYWELAPAGSRAERILNYARERGLDIGIYMGSAAGNAAFCNSPMTPFGMDNVSEWKKRDRNGHCAAENCIASDEFVEWFYQVQCNTIEKYEITLWNWDPGPGNGFFCYSSDHGHIPGKGAYKGFRNAMNIVKRLKGRFPHLYIQGFHGTKEYGLWGFRGFDQHESYWEQDPYRAGTIYPDISEDRLTAGGMRFQSAWNQLFRFMPPEMNHALASRMTQSCRFPEDLLYLNDELGWKYAFFSSLAVGASMTVTMIPFNVDTVSQGEYLAYFKKWIPWAREHFDYARYSKPFGAQVACGAMDGFARIKGSHGFLFLFNPGPIDVGAQFNLDDEIGLNVSGKYMLKWLYPMEDTFMCDKFSGKDVFEYGDKIHLQLPPYSSTLLELKSVANVNTSIAWRNLPGTLSRNGPIINILDCVGLEGRNATGIILRAESVEKVYVNGVDMPYRKCNDLIEVPLCFGREALPVTLYNWVANGTPFQPIHHTATHQLQLSTHFPVPQSIRERLMRYDPSDKKRQETIIALMKEKLKRENYAWAEPHRLHLVLLFANPDHVKDPQVYLNNQPLKLSIVSASQDNILTKIVYFTDITDRVSWSEDNSLTIKLGAMDANSFLGARLDYPEGCFTEIVSPCDPLHIPLSNVPLGMPRTQIVAQPYSRMPVVENAWIVDGIIQENHPYTLCASVNLPYDQLEGVYASAQISIDSQSGTSLRADQRLIYDPVANLWKRDMHPGSRRLLIIDGKDIHVWAISAKGEVSKPLCVAAEWKLQGY